MASRAFLRFAKARSDSRTTTAAAAAALVSLQAFAWTACDEPLVKQQLAEGDASGEKPATTSTISSSASNEDSSKKPVLEGMRPDEQGDFYGLFPKRQLWQPKLEYPLWDTNWDGRELESTGEIELDLQRARYIRKTGVTRHIILIRHGQYDETHKEDEKRILTPLGRKQAEMTGQRLAEMIRGAHDDFGPCNVKVLAVSNLERAKETSRIISEYLPDSIERAEPEPLLNEGRPCHHIPGGKASKKVIDATDTGHPRIESAFQKFFHRAPPPPLPESIDPEDDPSSEQQSNEPVVKEKHEFEIIVCHANVIRYFLCRAMQIPPETWLRMCPFNCSLTYLTIRPTGTVSVRMLGDIGHLSYGQSTFSGHHGFNW